MFASGMPEAAAAVAAVENTRASADEFRVVVVEQGEGRGAEAETDDKKAAKQQQEQQARSEQSTADGQAITDNNDNDNSSSSSSGSNNNKRPISGADDTLESGTCQRSRTGGLGEQVLQFIARGSRAKRSLGSLLLALALPSGCQTRHQPAQARLALREAASHQVADERAGAHCAGESILLGASPEAPPELASGGDPPEDANEASLSSLVGQLLLLVCGLFVLVHLVNVAQLTMTNLLTKFLGGERRRSLASSSSSSGQRQQHQQQEASSERQLASGIAQSHSSSTLSLPRNSSPTGQQASTAAPQRRASRSSIHSVSAMLMSALTGGSSGASQGQSSSSPAGTNNGRSIISKNKEDTVIIASSSPTIIQKESTDSGTSTVVSGSTVATSSIVSVSPAISAAGIVGSDVAVGDPGADLVILDQTTLYDSVRHPLAQLLAASGPASNVIGVAAAAVAAGEPQQQQQLLLGQLPTVSTQLALDGQTLTATASAGSAASSGTQQSSGHAPLNATNTMKQAPGASSPTTSTSSPRKPAAASSSASVIARRCEVIKATELLLNALNQGDYDTYTRLCDPHMTSFEPENLGHLIDNMEYRRICLDQARQLQFHHLYQQQVASAAASQSQSSQQVAAAVAAAAASAVMATSGGASNNGNSGPKQLSGQQLQQVAQAAALGAAQAALANLSLGGSQAQSSGAGNPPAGATNSTQAAKANSLSQQQGASTLHLAQLQPTNCASSLRQYSIMVNPSVHLLGDEAASIAYTKLSQTVNLATGQLCSEQSEETRVWHRRDGNKWLCVHFHRSQASSPQPLQNGQMLFNSLNSQAQPACGPQTSVSLVRSMFNQQQLITLQQLQPQHQQTNVPLISLNHSSAGGVNSSGSSSSCQNQSAPNNSSR